MTALVPSDSPSLADSARSKRVDSAD
jgi:hypothetical protein